MFKSVCKAILSCECSIGEEKREGGKQDTIASCRVHSSHYSFGLDSNLVQTLLQLLSAPLLRHVKTQETACPLLTDQ